MLSLIVTICLLLTIIPSSAPAAVLVNTAAGLAQAVENANWSGGDRTILVANGTYYIDAMLWIEVDGVTIRGQSGNRDAVFIYGEGMGGRVSHIFNVNGSNFVTQDMTIGRVANHAIQMQPRAQSPIIRNMRLVDTYEQMIKIAFNDATPTLHSDGGLVEGCLFEYTAGIGPQWYIGGIDGHRARNWVVRSNTFKNIKSPADDVAEHAVHFWSWSQNTLVERNRIISCDRGIGFGLGDRGHIGGIIRNNMIYHDTSEGFADVAIGLENCSNAQVYNNTIYMANTYENAIEYRWGGSTGILIANNLTNKAITSRDGGAATLAYNHLAAQSAWFVSAATGDLHLVSTRAGVTDSGMGIGGLYNDYDDEPRPQGAGIDIGADEKFYSLLPWITSDAYGHFYGAVDLGGTYYWHCTIKNLGQTNLTITGISGLPVYGFSLTLPTSFPQTLAHNAGMYFQVRYIPNTLGPLERTFTINSNATNEPNLAIKVSAAPGRKVSPWMLLTVP